MTRNSILVFLDLSAAFDTVDHDILINRLQKFVGLSGPVLDWFKTYLSGRDYFVSIGGHSSANTCTTCGVPQGSILGPVFFSLYMLPLGNIIRNTRLVFIAMLMILNSTSLYHPMTPALLMNWFNALIISTCGRHIISCNQTKIRQRS